jgi:iron complex transport system ATP-binding protein
MLRFENVEIGRNHLLFKVENVTLETRKCYAIVAPNGAGKTSFLLSLLKQLQLFSGSIFFGGDDFSKISSTQLSKLIAFVPSRFEGIEFLTVEQYVALGRSPYTNMFGYLSEKDLHVIAGSLEKLGLAAVAKTPTNELSDGMRQLCAIALALAQQTPIILLDEPTAFLDYANKSLVMNVLKDISVKENITILLSSHDLDLCINHATHFLILDKNSKTLVRKSGCDIAQIVSQVF